MLFSEHAVVGRDVDLIKTVVKSHAPAESLKVGFLRNRTTKQPVLYSLSTRLVAH